MKWLVIIFYKIHIAMRHVQIARLKAKNENLRSSIEDKKKRLAK